jgi:AI-2 transport protein TqsA
MSRLPVAEPAVGPSSTSLIVIATLVVIAAGIKAAEALVVPFLLAAFIATIAVTPLFWLERRRVPSPVAIVLVMTAIVAALIGIGMLVAQSASEFTARLPFYEARFVTLARDTASRLEPFGIEVSIDAVLAYLDPASAFSLAGNIVKALGSVLSNAFLILLTVIFILAEASSFPRKLRAVLDDPERDLPHFASFARTMNRYMAIKTTVSAATGLLVWILLTVLGVDFPVLWALLAFLLNFIPNIGSIIAAVPAVLLALIQLGPMPALVAAGGYVGINMLMGNYVETRFMGRGLGLSTLVVFVSLVFWGWMLGPVGMLLSVPLTMTAKIALEANPASAWIGHLLDPADIIRAPTEPPADETAEATETSS